MSDEQLAELERLCQAATPGPWERVPYGGDWRSRDECLNVSRFLDGKAGAEIAHRSRETIFSGWLVKRSNVEFITAARTAMPELIAEVRRLRGIVQSLADRCAAQSDILSRRAEKS